MGQFGKKVLGLAEGRGPTEENLYFRIDEVSARSWSSSRPTSTGSSAWAGRSPTTTRCSAPASTSKKAGVEIAEGTPEELADRRVQELVRFTDPFDNVFELFHGITYERAPSDAVRRHVRHR